LKSDWQRHVLASSGYLELGMFDDAAMVLEEIAPKDKNRNDSACDDDFLKLRLYVSRKPNSNSSAKTKLSRSSLLTLPKSA
jgi:hypothetical protein